MTQSYKGGQLSSSNVDKTLMGSSWGGKRKLPLVYWILTSHSRRSIDRSRSDGIFQQIFMMCKHCSKEM